MSYGFEVFKSNGNRVFSSDDKTFVLIDEFEIGAGTTGSRSYPGYSNARVFTIAIRTEPGSTQSLCPGRTYTFGHIVQVGGDSSTATVNWFAPSYFSSAGGGTSSVPPSTSSTVYVFTI